MTDETQASEPERVVRPPDPLSLTPESKNPFYDYQWHAVGGFAKNTSRDLEEDTGWVAVPRDAMPTEQSSSDEFIQRREMRLYFRPRAMSDKARTVDIENALAPIRTIEAILHGGGGGFPGLQGNIRVPPRHAFKEPERVQEDWPTRKTRIEKHKRGRVLVVHEATLPKKWHTWAHRHQYAAQWLRIVYLPRDESEMANRMNLSYADWSWAKIDLYREGNIGMIMVPRHRRQRKRRVW